MEHNDQHLDLIARTLGQANQMGTTGAAGATEATASSTPAALLEDAMQIAARQYTTGMQGGGNGRGRCGRRTEHRWGLVQLLGRRHGRRAAGSARQDAGCTDTHRQGRHRGFRQAAERA